MFSGSGLMRAGLLSGDAMDGTPVPEMVEADVGEDAFRSLTPTSTTYDPLPDNGSDTTADTTQSATSRNP